MSYSPPQDAADELPTYANLQAEAEAEGGASAARWNRWRGWIEKRCILLLRSQRRDHTLTTLIL